MFGETVFSNDSHHNDKWKVRCLISKSSKDILTFITQIGKTPQGI